MYRLELTVDIKLHWISVSEIYSVSKHVWQFETGSGVQNTHVYISVPGNSHRGYDIRYAKIHKLLD